MIRLVASTIRPRPYHSNLRDICYAISCLHDGICIKAQEIKMCKLVLLRNEVPLDLFAVIQPYLIMKHKKEFYPMLRPILHSRDKNYLLTESKLYRLDIIPFQVITHLRWVLVHMQYSFTPVSKMYYIRYLKNNYETEYTHDQLLWLLEYWI